jgi:hypothetical protein
LLSVTRYTGFQDTLFYEAGELTAPGTTTAVLTYENNYFSTKDYTLIATVTNINTEVVVRLDGSIDGTNYGPLISNCITKNGTYVYNITGSPVKYVRGNFFSETGGTSAVVRLSFAAR